MRGRNTPTPTAEGDTPTSARNVEYRRMMGTPLGFRRSRWVNVLSASAIVSRREVPMVSSRAWDGTFSASSAHRSVWKPRAAHTCHARDTATAIKGTVTRTRAACTTPTRTMGVATATATASRTYQPVRLGPEALDLHVLLHRDVCSAWRDEGCVRQPVMLTFGCVLAQDADRIQ